MNSDTKDYDDAHTTADLGRKSSVSKPVCDFCPKDARVPATHAFETAAGREIVACAQHANIAMTCMKYLRRIGV